MLDLPGSPHAVPDPRPDPDQLERQDILRARRGNNTAFARVIRENDPILRAVVALLVDPDSVDEIVLTTYLRAYRGLPTYQDRQAPRLWLVRLAVTVSLDQLRRRHRPRPRRHAAVGSVAPSPPEAVPTPKVDEDRLADDDIGVRILRSAGGRTGGDGDGEGDVEDAEAPSRPSDVEEGAQDRSAGEDGDPAVDRLRGALDRLLVEDRVTLVLVDGVGLTESEAAIAVQISPATLETRLRRARAGLRQYLSADEADGSELPTPDPDDPAGWLALIDVPEHSSWFWPKVGEELLAARDRPALPAPDTGETRIAAWSAAAGGPPRAPTAPDEALPERLGRERLGRERLDLERLGPERLGPERLGAESRNVRGLAYRARVLGAQGGRFRSVALGFGIAVVLGAFVLGGFLLAGRATKHDAQLDLTSPRVIRSVNGALANSQSISGTVTADGGGEPVPATTYSFLRSADGSYRVRAPDIGWTEAYDATHGTLVVDGSPPGAQPVHVASSGLAPGPPDPTAGSDGALGDPLAAIVHLMEIGGNRAVTKLGDNGPTQYVIDADLPIPGSAAYRDSGLGVLPGLGRFASTGGADHVRVVIDEQLQLPVDVQVTKDQGTVVHLRFTNLQVGQQPGRSAFTVPAPAGLTAVDRGFTSVDLPQVKSKVGYTPVTPGFLPRDFELVAVAVQARPPARSPSTAGGRNPPDQDVTVLTYRRGADVVVVTTRRFTSQAGRLWHDPFAASGPGASHDVTISSGAFINVQAHAGSSPINHVWGQNQRLVFTVSGTLSLSQLERVASSLS